MKNANELFKQHTGSEQFYRTNFNHVITEEANDLCDNCQSFWLIDVILSYQIYGNVRQKPFQVWKLERVKNNRFMVTATDGNENVLATQKIPFSDFPHDSATLWNVNSVIMLPSEY